jgi:benzoyl-CoA reductase/2-hydroxyglutaryl-CoA dehydratase subunit BcrC/BadD/HgdB
LVRKALERVGVRTVAVEIDISDPFPGQVTTRIEALMESLA